MCKIDLETDILITFIIVEYYSFNYFLESVGDILNIILNSGLEKYNTEF